VAADDPGGGTSDCQPAGSIEAQALQDLDEHIKHAHLERSPAQQLDDIAHVDEYAKLHMGLVQNLTTPTLEALSTGLCAPGGEPDMSMPAPAPGGSAPAPVPQAPPAPAPQAPAPAPAPAPPAPAPAPKPPAQVEVRMAKLAFTPQTLRIQKGDTVVWANGDTTSHTVTSTGGGFLKSPTLDPGKSYKRTFTAAGTYRYNCSIHPDMRGSVVVSG
jgi:plastocyanin